MMYVIVPALLVLAVVAAICLLVDVCRMPLHPTESDPSDEDVLIDSMLHCIRADFLNGTDDVAEFERRTDLALRGLPDPEHRIYVPPVRPEPDQLTGRHRGPSSGTRIYVIGNPHPVDYIHDRRDAPQWFRGGYQDA